MKKNTPEIEDEKPENDYYRVIKALFSEDESELREPRGVTILRHFSAAHRAGRTPFPEVMDFLADASDKIRAGEASAKALKLNRPKAGRPSKERINRLELYNSVREYEQEGFGRQSAKERTADEFNCDLRTVERAYSEWKDRTNPSSD